MGPVRLDSPAHRLAFRLAYALHRVKIGKLSVLGQLAALEDQNACRGSKKLARDRKSSRAATDYDKIRGNGCAWAQRAKIVNPHSFSVPCLAAIVMIPIGLPKPT